MAQPSQSGPKQTWQRGAAPSSAVTSGIIASASPSPSSSSALGVDGIVVEELINEVGMLDDVFYDITAHVAHRETPYA